MNVDRKSKNECIDSKCKYLTRCLVFHGDDCVKLDGDKIPVMCCVSEARTIPIEKPSEFKPYFIGTEWAETEGR